MLDRIAIVTGNACPAPSSPGSSIPSARKDSWTWPQESPTAGRPPLPRSATPTRPESGLFQGTVDGTLATESRGTSGFGYDPVFIPDGDSGHRTWAEMTSEEKNKVSHRRRAVEAMRNDLGLQ